MFIVRSQGFFYTDEYYAPTTQFRHILKRTFATRAEAEAARAELVRAWLRNEPLDNYLFDDSAAIERVMAYLTQQFPDEGLAWGHETCIPRDATDAQVDEIAKRMGVTFAEVHEVGLLERLKVKPHDGDGDARDDRGFDDQDLHYGPRKRERDELDDDVGDE